MQQEAILFGTVQILWDIPPHQYNYQSYMHNAVTASHSTVIQYVPYITVT